MTFRFFFCLIKSKNNKITIKTELREKIKEIMKRKTTEQRDQTFVRPVASPCAVSEHRCYIGKRTKKQKKKSPHPSRRVQSLSSKTLWNQQTLTKSIRSAFDLTIIITTITIIMKHTLHHLTPRWASVVLFLTVALTSARLILRSKTLTCLLLNAHRTEDNFSDYLVILVARDTHMLYEYCTR